MQGKTAIIKNGPLLVYGQADGTTELTQYAALFFTASNIQTTFRGTMAT